jgi:hypothetical protein
MMLGVVVRDAMSTRESPFTTGFERTEVGDALQHAVVAPLRALSFWTAVLLPLAYLPLLADGLAGGEASVLFALVAVNAVALLLGHEHAR